jgi:hypothetical protein
MDARLQRADDIWRARSRLQRGDSGLAEPLFERLFQATPDRRGETDLIIAEGLLRCRLDRAALQEAFIPALEVARLHRLGIETNRYDDLTPLFDESTLLCTQLVPIWALPGSTQRLQTQLADWNAGGDATLRALADRLARLASNPGGQVRPLEMTDAGEAVGSTGSEATELGAGERLLDLLIDSRSLDPVARRKARASIQQQLARRTGWRLPWLRFALGTSLLLEPGEGRRRQGMVELAWIPAVFGESHPALAATSMRLMFNELEAQGEFESAKRLEDEALARYRNHPDWRQLETTTTLEKPNP